MRERERKRVAASEPARAGRRAADLKDDRNLLRPICLIKHFAYTVVLVSRFLRFSCHQEMMNERLELVMKLIDDDIDQDIDFHERQIMQLRVWRLAHAEFPQPPRETIKGFKNRMKNMWISTANVCGLHFWARRFLVLQSSPPRNLAEDGLALAMGLHPRLGARCILSKLSVDILSVVLRHLSADIEADTQASFEAKYALWKYFVNVNMKCHSSVLFYFRLYSSDIAQFERACSLFMADTDKDPMWRMLLED